MVIIVIGVFIFLFFFKTQSAPGVDNGGTNFWAQFNPFGNGKPKPPTPTPPTDVSGYVPPEPVVENIKLKKVSSMPIAGFTVYLKERLKSVPLPTVATPDVTPKTDTSPTSTTNPDATVPATSPTKTTTKKTPVTKSVVKPTAPLTEFMPSLRYVARENGNIYQTFADKIEERKFSTTIIPKIYEALFGNKGETVVMRYLKDDGRTIETFVGSLPKELLGADTSITNEVKGSFLSENIQDISLSPDTSSIFYLITNRENTAGITMNLLTSKKMQIFSSAFNEWLSFWPNNKIITLTTKPSFGTLGYMYSINSDTKNLTKILGGTNGLTTETSPEGKLILYGDNNLSLNIYHTDTKTTDPVSVRTLPEKCVWGKLSAVVYCAVPKLINTGSYPDTWYQGEVSFSDQIWKIDVSTGKVSMLVDPITVKGGEEIDGIKLALDEGENYLFFVNKKDSFLWEFDLR